MVQLWNCIYMWEIYQQHYMCSPEKAGFHLWWAYSLLCLLVLLHYFCSCGTYKTTQTMITTRSGHQLWIQYIAKTIACYCKDQTFLCNNYNWVVREGKYKRQQQTSERSFKQPLFVDDATFPSIISVLGVVHWIIFWCWQNHLWTKRMLVGFR